MSAVCWSMGGVYRLRWAIERRRAVTVRSWFVTARTGAVLLTGCSRDGGSPTIGGCTGALGGEPWPP